MKVMRNERTDKKMEDSQRKAVGRTERIKIKSKKKMKRFERKNKRMQVISI